jgi:hypothetical protein
MTRLLFSLRGVPEDEAEDVRELLDENNIDYYETNAGNWGISMPGLWINNEDDWLEARKMLSIYQENRYKQQRTYYQQLKKEGKHKRLIDALKQKPAQFLFYVGFIVLIIYISIKLVFEIGL